jgi:hypothetical protein
MADARWTYSVPVPEPEPVPVPVPVPVAVPEIRSSERFPSLLRRTATKSRQANGRRDFGRRLSIPMFDQLIQNSDDHIVQRITLFYLRSVEIPPSHRDLQSRAGLLGGAQGVVQTSNTVLPLAVRALGDIQRDAGSTASDLPAQLSIESFDNVDQRFEFFGRLDS